MSRDPDSFQAHFELSIALQSQGRIDAAIARCLRSLELQPRASGRHVPSGRAALCNGTSIAEAEAIFRRLVERNPMDSDAWKNLGVCLYRQDRAEEALAAGTRADAIASERRPSRSRCSPSSPPISATAGIPHVAVDMLERNLARFPDPAAHYLYGQLLLKVGRLPEGWVQHEFRWLARPVSCGPDAREPPGLVGAGPERQAPAARARPGLRGFLPAHPVCAMCEGSRRNRVAAVAARARGDRTARSQGSIASSTRAGRSRISISTYR